MLYVIRHGEVKTNIEKKINGWNDDELTNLGIKQSYEAGIKLKDINIDYIFSSPLKRAKQTLINLNLDSKIPIYYDDKLKERNSNSMVYKNVNILDSKIWYDKEKDIVYIDSEGFKSIIDRVSSLLDKLKNEYQDKDILLVTHGDVCKAIYLYFNKDIDDISKFRQKNCEIKKYRL